MQKNDTAEKRQRGAKPPRSKITKVRPVAIMSILRAQTPGPERSFDALMGAAGQNTGNLLFTNAVWSQVRGPKQRLGFSINPQEVNTTYSALVIPAANWLGPHVDFSDLADQIEQLDIPVVLIGLGAQNADYSGQVHLPDGTLRFVRAVSERSRSISVRGAFTRDVLAAHGIRNATVTGCPSLYRKLQPKADATLRRRVKKPTGPTLLHSTRYSAVHPAFLNTPSIHRELFRYAYASSTDLLLQSEPEEISMLVEASGKPDLCSRTMTNLRKIYGAEDWASFESYLHAHAKVFFDIPAWSDAVTGYGNAFGTRLHATILALCSGVPAVLVHHDSRTQEIAEFARLPSISAAEAELSDDAIRACIGSADIDAFIVARRENAQVYAAFLADNGLAPRVNWVNQPAP